MSDQQETALKGQVAIVTGGTRGYGQGIAAVLKKKGAEVWITGRNRQDLARTAREVKVDWLQADVTREKDSDKLLSRVLEKHGRLDILVNNAGAAIRIAALDQQSDEEIRRSLEVNLTGAILGCRRAAAVMKKQKAGIILNILSVCAMEAWPEWSVYSAAKAGLWQFSRCLYTELRPFGVRVSSILPSWGATDFLQAAGRKGFNSRIKTKCIQPEELGELVAFVCSLPAHLCLEHLTLWPMVQEVVPL
ncbi:MAG TPA: SDR family oxidoreductase [bacterium]|nr:SDR family oxidoreductase [bacterium]HOL66736.1 SDR family oxidoreductase [bacterium]HPP11714.1 SDR family oxidoreductase [bacterium]